MRSSHRPESGLSTGKPSGTGVRLALAALMLLASATTRLEAAFIGPYAPGNFNLINTEADGFVDFRPNGSLVITGGNSGSGLLGTTDLLIAAPGSGLVQFNFSYSTVDSALLEVVGYMIGTDFTQLGDRDGANGAVSFAVTSGQMFGFRISTEDNLGEPGVLTITNFEGPGGTVVPEPSTWLTEAAGLALLLAAARRRLGARQAEEEA